MMVHPALAAISIGVGIGVALWVFLVNRNESHSYDHHSQETHRNQPREPQSSGSRNRTDTEDECDICRERGNCKAVLSCGHKFHLQCIRELRIISKKCPTCNKDAQLRQESDFSWRDPLRRDREGAGVCSICFEAVSHQATLQCGHEFHLKCISDWRNFGTGDKCPNCRGPLRFS